MLCICILYYNYYHLVAGGKDVQCCVFVFYITTIIIYLLGERMYNVVYLYFILQLLSFSCWGKGCTMLCICILYYNYYHLVAGGKDVQCCVFVFYITTIII